MSRAPHPFQASRPGFARRTALQLATNGFGWLALRGLLGAEARKRDTGAPLPHFRARAKRVVFLYMDGGVSQVDSFDPKPRLEQENGQPIGMKIPATQFDDVGNVLRSPWKFRQHGESGLWVSDLFPHLARCADELCLVRSMTSEFPEHTNANYFLHTGFGQQGRPSVGSWIHYGLGSENRNVPGFVVLNGGLIPVGGLDNFNAGFLPAAFQGSVFRTGAAPVTNLAPPDGDFERQARKLELLGRLEERGLTRTDDTDPLEATIENYELAFRMQSTVPELLDLRGESAATRALYGLDAEFPHTRTYGTQCLLARRLLERGVRFVEITCPKNDHDRWDQHSNLAAGHADNARAVDQPIAGLLRDLRARGLLEDTLVLWAGEFGRTPMAQGQDGRDHNPHGFSIWLAGGGVRAGSTYGSTDEYGYFAVDGRVTIHDLHATILHLLGFDHTQLTYHFSGRDMRLTDVHGEVIEDWLA